MTGHDKKLSVLRKYGKVRYTTDVDDMCMIMLFNNVDIPKLIVMKSTGDEAVDEAYEQLRQNLRMEVMWSS